LASPVSGRPAIETQSFAKTPLSKQDAERAQQLLWDDFTARVRETRANEVGATETVAKSVTVAGSTMKYYMATRGSEPSGGRSLFISMHGGGNAPAATNDQQWQNQISLVDSYNPKDALWIAPRAPSDDWNMWFTDNVDALFERIITNMIVFEKINPNKVYINGYSAGGDGVYQLGPRMAECWAGAGMSAGHPNDASPVNLRNVAFAIHVGGSDTSYDRNKKAEEWGKMLEDLASKDPGGYINQWEVHAGLPHWMNMADAVSIPFLQSYTRNPIASKVVWRQRTPKRPHFYWLAIDEVGLKVGAEVRASYAKNTVTVSDVKDVKKLKIRLSDAMMNLDQPIQIKQSETELFSGTVSRTIAVIARTLEEHGDPTMIFYAQTAVDLK
jgi:poly(3-hydroxybutyrate) depolymerase